MRVKRINVYLYGGSLYCPFCGREIDYEKPCEHVVFIARRLIDELHYQISEMLDREPWRGKDLLFTYVSDKFREVYERVYGKPPAFDEEDYVKRGSIKIKDAINLLKSNFWSKSDIILFKVLVCIPSSKVLVCIPSSGHGLGPGYLAFIALLKDGYIIK